MRAFWTVAEKMITGDESWIRASKLYDVEAEAIAGAKELARSGNPEVFVMAPTMSFKARLDMDVVEDEPEIDNPVGDGKETP